MPNRMIRDGFLDSEAINSLTPHSEVFFHRLLLAADDAGRFDGRTKIIASRLFPLRSGSMRASDAEKWLSECAQAGLVTGYERNGNPYIQIMKWQRAGQSKTSKYPDSNGMFAITYVELETRDGVKEFVSTSIPHTDGIDTPSTPHTDGVSNGCKPHKHPTDTPSSRARSKTDTKTDTNYEDGNPPTSPPPGDGVKIPDALKNAPGFLEAWGKWVPFRMKIKCCKDFPLMFRQQLEKLSENPESAAAVVNKSIMNGWQGLFPIEKSNVVQQYQPKKEKIHGL